MNRVQKELDLWKRRIELLNLCKEADFVQLLKNDTVLRRQAKQLALKLSAAAIKVGTIRYTGVVEQVK
jgi:hypothetical protein